MRTIRAARYTVRGTRRAEREVESWAALAILAMLLFAAAAVVLVTFIVPAVIGGVTWLGGAAVGGDGGSRTKQRGARIAGWPWRRLSRAIYGR